MLRNRKVNEPDLGKPGEIQGAVKRPAAATEGQAKRKRGGLGDLSNIITNTLHIDSAKATKITGKQHSVAGLEVKEKITQVAVKKSGKQLQQNARLDAVPEDSDKDSDNKTDVDSDETNSMFDFDLENAGNPNMMSEYARGIFEYYMQREEAFTIGDYASRQVHFTKGNRAQVVDWLVGIQQKYEYNHETFYTAVKVFDHFMDKTGHRFVAENLQLIGSVVLFIAAKFEENFAPAMQELVYICKETFTEADLVRMERLVLKTIEFDLGFPLAYHFLRRYGKVLYLDMPTLTLARYYLETCTMYYEFISVRDSLMASACLLLAFRVSGLGDWNKTLTKCSGYVLEEVEPLMWTLNHAVLKRPEMFPSSREIYTKYRSTVFFEVAAYRLLPDRFARTDPVGPPAALSFAVL